MENLTMGVKYAVTPRPYSLIRLNFPSLRKLSFQVMDGDGSEKPLGLYNPFSFTISGFPLDPFS
jgi:hypothetical protein